MNKQLVYDLPTRIFHWLFAGLFVCAFMIAKTIDDESPIFSYHMLAGLLLGFVVFLRILWGFVGSKYSRFSSFALHPKDLLAYIKGIFSGEKQKWAGHNPASSWATLAMIGFALGLAFSGYQMASGQKEAYEDLHELFANGFLIVVLLHIAGVVLHAFRHQDRIAMTMIDGTKSEIPLLDRIERPKMGVALVFLVLVAVFAMNLFKNFDSNNQTLKLFGNTLQLGENEEGENNESEEHEDKGNQDKDSEKDDD
ncbi:MAG: cytochrome b/b6 domain-containing protein [Proteobacteria bacterium]|nr:cytochrome b/b6 domain-containing protein [Pseudomonadota bacterium]